MGEKEKQTERVLTLEEKRLLELKDKLVSSKKLEETFAEFCALYTMFICRGASTLMVNFPELEKLKKND
jgi:hypothetical protein